MSSASSASAAIAFLIFLSSAGTCGSYAETSSGEPPSPCVITIQSVELKNSAGQWVTVIEPDRRVDLAKEEPGLSFFNNGRVPDGKYVNFRVNFFQSAICSISGSRDFNDPLVLKKGSYVGVWFTLDLNDLTLVQGLSVTVDEDSRSLGVADVWVRSDKA